MRRFLPADLPVLYAMSDEVQFLRQMQSAKENSHGVFSNALASLLGSVQKKTLATLYINLNSSLIQKFLTLTDTDQLKSMAQVLYV